MFEPIQDTITFSLRAEHVVTNDTVKISVALVALVSDENRASINDLLRERLRAFINTDGWKIYDVRRVHDAGMERMTLKAVCRVSEAENHDLEGRARDASMKGLEIKLAEQPDISIPAQMIEEAHEKLRQKILLKARAEVQRVQTIDNRSWRVSEIDYSQEVNMGRNKSLVMASSYDAASVSGSETLGNSQKIEMSASVTLRVIVVLPNCGRMAEGHL